MHVQPQLAHLQQLALQPIDLQFFAQHFVPGLAEQQIVGIVLAKHLVEKPARRLDLPGALLRCRVAAKHQPGDLGDLAKAPQRHLARVEAGQYVLQQLLGR
ncbi:hypothetical protein D3C79_1006180 [compost metagenome]